MNVSNIASLSAYKFGVTTYKQDHTHTHTPISLQGKM